MACLIIVNLTAAGNYELTNVFLTYSAANDGSACLGSDCDSHGGVQQGRLQINDMMLAALIRLSTWELVDGYHTIMPMLRA